MTKDITNPNSRIIIFSGCSGPEYVHAVQDIISREGLISGCVYNKDPGDNSEREYLSMFDFVVDIRAGSGSFEGIMDKVAAVVSTSERNSELYIELLAKFGKISPAQRRLYHLANNKRDFKDFLRDYMPEAVPLCWDLKDFEGNASVASLPFPLIVKPTGLTGSLFTKVIHNESQMASFVTDNREKIISAGREKYARDVSIMAEEFIGGNQYSANCYINSFGFPLLCPITRVVPAFEMGIDDTFYSAFQYTDSNLTKNEIRGLEEILSKAASLLRLESTSAHFDVVRHRTGWKILEIGLRTGSPKHRFFGYSHSMNHLENDILNRLGKNPFIPPQQRVVCIVQKAAAERGILQSIQIHERNYLSTIVPDKIEMEETGKEALPVSLGGKLLTRHFVIGNDSKQVLEDAKRLFDAIKFQQDIPKI